jgi:predicted nucleic acid-binding protein
MAYLLDTDVVIPRLGGDPAARELVRQLAPAGVVISVATYMEVYQGIFANVDPVPAESEFLTLLENLPVLPFTEPVARRCALLRADLAARGSRVRSRSIDLIIAATALHHGLTLVTRNVEDYADIPNLQLR